MQDYTEDRSIEQPAIQLFARLGYETRNAYRETPDAHPVTGRARHHDVVLLPRLRAALERLNPTLSPELINRAIEELTRDRSALGPVRANREVYSLLKKGVKLSLRESAGEQGGWTAPGESDDEDTETVRVIDWNGDDPTANDFLLVSQFWVKGDIYTRRADLVLFVNGLPLVLFELKSSHTRLSHAFENNLRDYKASIPQLFWYNAFIILSNGHDSKIGSITAGWEYFFDWKKINDEGEQGVVSLETLIRGTCAKSRLLDLIENFTLFSEARGGLVKIIAQNHQYLGVNRAFDAIRNLEKSEGKLGVFWHTQGSGKSFSMLFFTQKVRRKLSGNWTFLIVTDRKDLDEQIYNTFAHAGAVTEPVLRASSAKHLQELLREDHLYVFTLIQKFRTEKPGQVYEQLSDRTDIIVITDEAHRTEYDTLAGNMHNALPRASFLGFTGTPLLAGEAKTRAVFGDYVSIYNFSESVKNRTTVPLFYENRTPELELTNEEFNTDMEHLLEEEDLTDEQEKLLLREFSREYNIITRDERLEKIAEDIVQHFMGRGYMGKAMVVSIDKMTAVRMYDKVRKYWERELASLRAQYASLTAEQPELREELAEKIAYMEATDMAVVISQSQNEIEKFREKGLEILPHRLRMEREDLEDHFKDELNPLRIVFVCAMWMTGFDVPSLSTIYLDKPMRNHTLMQTIARANRVFQDKLNGLIVDYIGIFRHLRVALALYGTPADGEMPIKSKQELVTALQQAIDDIETFCTARAVDLQDILTTPLENFARIAKIEVAVDKLVVNDETRKNYLTLASNASKLYKAILPDVLASTYTGLVAVCTQLVRRIRLLTPDPDISDLMEGVADLLDTSIGTRKYIIREPSGPYEVQGRIDLSQIDFDALKAEFAQAHKHTEAERLRGLVTSKVRRMVRLNKTRTSFQERLERLIDEYNAGSANIDLYYYELIDFARDLNAEEQRTLSENLSEEELAIFDLLTRPELQLPQDDREQIKKVARDLLSTLKREKLVLDWRKKQQARAQVQVTVQSALDALPDVYTKEMYIQKCMEIYEHIYGSYHGEDRSIYASA